MRLISKKSSSLGGIACCASLLSACGTLPGADSATIAMPGPDAANYPNSAYTLPQGRAYFEAIPAAFFGEARYVPQEFNAGYLLRYGLSDDFEVRLSSTGLVLQDGNPKDKSGFGPLVFGLKWHLSDDVSESLMPAIGIEAALQTTWGSKAFRSGTQPLFSLNFDKELGSGIMAEFNIGFIGNQDIRGESIYQLDLAWALQRNISEQFALYIDGYATALSGLTTSAIGGGAQWTVNERMALFSKINAGLTNATPSLYYQLGFAVAF